MLTKKVQALTLEGFKSYGTFSTMINPSGPHLGVGPVAFYRDPLQLDNAGSASFSVTRTEPRELIVKMAEYHNHCGEALMPIDGDIYIHVGYATGSDEVKTEEFEIFRVPMGTMVVIRPGVWHHAGFCTGDKPVNTLVVLPERAYKNDCTMVRLSEEQFIQIEA